MFLSRAASFGSPPPPIGAIVTFRYQELTKAGVPRFPSWVRVRADDTSDLATQTVALTDALGVHTFDMPATPERVWRVLQETSR